MVLVQPLPGQCSGTLIYFSSLMALIDLNSKGDGWKLSMDHLKEVALVKQELLVPHVGRSVSFVISEMGETVLVGAIQVFLGQQKAPWLEVQMALQVGSQLIWHWS